MKAVLEKQLEPSLHDLLTDRLSDTLHCGLQDHTHVLVIEAGDSEEAVTAAIGFSPLSSRIDGIQNQPDWDWIERHGQWWELLYCIGNSGFAYIVLIEDADKSPFADLCRQNAG